MNCIYTPDFQYAKLVYKLNSKPKMVKHENLIPQNRTFIGSISRYRKY